MSAPAFALYSNPACAPGQRLSAGAALDLVTPVTSQGATLFRRSLWLPVPASARQATALELTGSALAIRYAPADIPIATGEQAWFSRSETRDNQYVRLDFVWPAPVRRFNVPAGSNAVGLELFRIDGEKVADDSSQSGTTGANLNPPWVGSPVEVRLAHPIFPNFRKENIDRPHKIKGKARAAGGGAIVVGQPGDHLGGVVLLDLVRQSEIIPTVTLAGRPTSPRLRLFLESPGTETLLWQALLPGEQGAAVTLPAQSVAQEWAGALEQVHKALAADTGGSGGARLRLDVESDAPCAVSLQQASLNLAGRYALAPEPGRLDFGGAQAERQAITLGVLPAGVVQNLTLRGRVEGEGAPAPAPGADPPPREGLLLGPDQALVLRLDLAAPQSLAGLGLLWHPLSDALQGRVQLLADGGTGPGRALVDQAIDLPTAAVGWLALRWPSLDLQAQALWLRLSLTAGAGLALAGASAPPPGWLERYAPDATRPPLALAPAWQWLDAADPGQAAAGGLRFFLGGQALSATREGAALTLSAPASALAGLGTTPIQASCAAPLRLTLESGELAVAL